VGLDDLFDNEQAQTRAVNALGGLTGEAMIFGEQGGQMRRRDAEPPDTSIILFSDNFLCKEAVNTA
jgi:hypothetical protein